MARRLLAPRRSLREHLDALVATYGVEHLHSDPVQWLHRFDQPADQELVGLLASTLAYGAVPIIQHSVGNALARLDHWPAAVVGRATADELVERFAGFRHRFHDGTDVALLLVAAQRLIAEFGSLGAAFTHYYERCGGDVREGLARTIDALRAAAGFAAIEARGPHAGIRHSLPEPRKGSACKRWNLYLRWMVRRADGIDLGLWTAIDPAGLVVPVDTHIARIGRFIGLTRRATPDWTMAEQITDALRAFDPADPVKYDFALCRLGILKVCRRTREASICTACPLDAVCCL